MITGAFWAAEDGSIGKKKQNGKGTALLAPDCSLVREKPRDTRAPHDQLSAIIRRQELQLRLVVIGVQLLLFGFEINFC